jgi:hypothetical protein
MEKGKAMVTVKVMRWGKVRALRLALTKDSKVGVGRSAATGSLLLGASVPVPQQYSRVLPLKKILVC